MRRSLLAKLVVRVLPLCLGLTIIGCGSDEMENRSGSEANENIDAAALTGNGAPNGKHFNLNLIGVPRDKTATITTGNRIFMPLFGSTKILLREGAFAVLDANGTDGSASFQLPDPDGDGDGITSYSVFARALGKPKGSISAKTCANDVISGEEVCSLETLVKVRVKGRSTFTNVSKELLSISADIDGDGVVERVSLFDDRLQDFSWNFDNQGLKLLQLRFVEIPTQL